VHGSPDGETWGAKPLFAFPPKFYKGIYTILLDLGQTPDIRFLRVRYKAARWGHWKSGPRFRFYVFVEPMPA
jgi:hypothetical protein